MKPTKVFFSICRFPFKNVNNPVDRIMFTEKHPTFAERFPPTNNGIVFGYNRFRNHAPFQQKDSIVTIYLRSHKNAHRVMLAGSFNDWRPNALAMQKTDSGWISQLKLKPGKYWYKFIIDERWRIDDDNLLKENDGYGNINSVFLLPTPYFNFGDLQPQIMFHSPAVLINGVPVI